MTVDELSKKKNVETRTQYLNRKRKNVVRIRNLKKKKAAKRIANSKRQRTKEKGYDPMVYAKTLACRKQKETNSNSEHRRVIFFSAVRNIAERTLRNYIAD